MTITEDLKNVSEAALGKLAAQFGDLPRPLLAAIGAGDAAVERLVRLRDQLGDLWDERGENDDAASRRRPSDGGTDGSGEGGSRLADATRRAQQIAEDVAHKLGGVVGEVPDRAQKLIADLPARAQDVANALSRENLRETVESYTRRVADVYRELADRGGARVQDAEDAEAGRAARSGAAGADGQTAGTQGDGGETATPGAAKRAAAKPSAGKPGGTRAAGSKAAGSKTTGAKSSGTKSGGTRGAGSKAAGAKPAAPGDV